eukprot:gene9588-12935_t
MFHCNGWCFPWTIAARAGVNVCLRRVDAQAIFDAIRNHGVTHYCGAPIVHGLLVNAPDAMKAGVPAGVKAMVAGAAPPASMIEGMEKMGFDLTHVYGLTEVYGPATVCAKQEAWDALDVGERARLNARQGVRYHLERDVRVLDPETMLPVPQDGEGEEFAKAVPAEKVFLGELLHVFRRGAAGAGFEEAAAVHERDDGEHLRAGADFENREEVGEVVAENIARDADRVLAGLEADEGGLAGGGRGHDLEVEAGGVVLREVGFHLGDELRIVGALLIEPEDGGRVGQARAIDGEFHPVLHGGILGLAGAPDVAGLDG